MRQSKQSSRSNKGHGEQGSLMQPTYIVSWVPVQESVRDSPIEFYHCNVPKVLISTCYSSVPHGHHHAARGQALVHCLSVLLSYTSDCHPEE